MFKKCNKLVFIKNILFSIEIQLYIVYDVTTTKNIYY